MPNAFYSYGQAKYCDILCVNRYYAWYSDTGHLEVIQLQMETEYTAWNAKYNKPILTSEYGADSVVGLHTASFSSYLFAIQQVYGE